MAITHLRKAASRLIGARQTLHARQPDPILSARAVFWLNTFVCVQFWMGSYFFFTWLDPWAVYAGDWCFIAGSSLTCLVSVCHVLDHLREMRYFQAEADLAKDDAVREKAQTEKEEKFDELMESACFLLASVIFSAGCVLFYPSLFTEKKHQEWGEEVGAFLFIAGSFGFVLAAWFNSLAMVHNASTHELPKAGSPEHQRRRIMALELFLSMVGSVLFVTGSFLYRPSYSTDCSHKALLEAAKASGAAGSVPVALLRRRSVQAFLGHMPLEGVPPAAAPQAMSEEFKGLCVNVMNQGTWLYLVGSTLFVLQCGLVAWRLSLPGGEPHGHKEAAEREGRSPKGEALLKAAAP